MVAIVAICEWEEADAHVDDSHSHRNATEVRRIKIRLARASVTELWRRLFNDNTEPPVLGEHAQREDYRMEIYDRTKSKYVETPLGTKLGDSMSADDESELLVVQRFGKIWRVRLTRKLPLVVPSTEHHATAFLALPGRAFSQDHGYPVGGAHLTIKELHNQRDATAFTVWDGGVLLADFLQKASWVIRGKHVLELGAGVGLVGLTAAALGAQSVLLTDLDDVMSILTENIVTNQNIWGSDAQVSCRTLDWFHPLPLPTPPSGLKCWDVVLLADCVWTLDLVRPLLGTLQALIEQSRRVGGTMSLLTSYQRRGHHAHEAFWTGVSLLFDLQEVDPWSYDISLPNPELILRKCTPKLIEK